MTPFDEDEFKALRAIWYAKLEKDGFEDLEDPEGNLKRDRRLERYQGLAPDKIKAVQEYFAKASEYLWQGKFKTKQDRKIWSLYCDGATREEIAKATKLHQSSVYRRIQKYLKLAGLARKPKHPSKPKSKP